MNHRQHWRIEPLYIPRPGDFRLWRCVVHKAQAKYEDFGQYFFPLDRKWEVHLQERNSQSCKWTTKEVFVYDEFENAITFAAIFNKRREQ